jgi:hypothetical protein
MGEKILSVMELRKISNLEMAAALRMSIQTFYRRLASPNHFTWGELNLAAKKFRMTVIQLIQWGEAK